MFLAVAKESLVVGGSRRYLLVLPRVCVRPPLRLNEFGSTIGGPVFLPHGGPSSSLMADRESAAPTARTDEHGNAVLNQRSDIRLDAEKGLPIDLEVDLPLRYRMMACDMNVTPKSL